MENEYHKHNGCPYSIEIRWHSKNVNAHALIKYRSQYVEADLNKVMLRSKDHHSMKEYPI